MWSPVCQAYRCGHCQSHFTLFISLSVKCDGICLPVTYQYFSKDLFKMEQLNHAPVRSQALILSTRWCMPIEVLLPVTQPFPRAEIVLFYFIIVEQVVFRQDLSPISACTTALCQTTHTVYRGVLFPPALQAAATALGDLPRVAGIWDYTVHLQQILPSNTRASRSEWTRAKFKENIFKTR